MIAIDARLATALGLKGKQFHINIKGIRDVDSCDLIGTRVDFVIEGDECEHWIRGAVAVSNLSFPTQTLSNELVREIARRQSVFLKPYNNAQTEILIGQNNLDAMLTREFRRIDENCAVSLTPLGWVAHGYVRDHTNNDAICLMREIDKNVFKTKNEMRTDKDDLDHLMRRYFEIDGLGIREVTKVSTKHARAFEVLEKTSRRVNTFWETGLLWKSEIAPNVDSRSTAINRLLSLERRLNKDAHYADLYYKEVDRFLERGYAVKVPDEEYRSRIWYRPHFDVTSASKPGKVLLVFDAAARTSGYSLNDQLNTGPDLLQNLFGILIRFRQYAVAIKGDIRDMYLRVKVRSEDRSALRFLWRGSRRRGDPDVYEMTCLVFGANSSPCSAIYVKDANAKSFATTKPDASASIIRNSYVDDYLTSRKTCEQANALVRDVIKIYAHANFEMHGWASNNTEALAGIDEKVRLQNSNSTLLCDRDKERVLGLIWDIRYTWF